MKREGTMPYGVCAKYEFPTVFRHSKLNCMN